MEIRTRSNYLPVLHTKQYIFTGGSPPPIKSCYFRFFHQDPAYLCSSTTPIFKIKSPQKQYYVVSRYSGYSDYVLTILAPKSHTHTRIGGFPFLQASYLKFQGCHVSFPHVESDDRQTRWTFLGTMVSSK